MSIINNIWYRAAIWSVIKEFPREPREIKASLSLNLWLCERAFFAVFHIYAECGELAPEFVGAGPVFSGAGFFTSGDEFFLFGGEVEIYGEGLDATAEYLNETLNDGDVVIVMGAGDVGKIIPKLL